MATSSYHRGEEVLPTHAIHKLDHNNAKSSYLPFECTPLRGKGAGAPFIPTPRRRINVLPIVASLLLPWVLFVLLSAAMGFAWRYYHPFVTDAFAAAALVAVLVPGLKAHRDAETRALGGHTEPSWHLFMFLTGTLAWCLAVGLGSYNFYQNSLTYYSYADLKVYSAVNPAQFTGTQLMDAGSIVFTENARLDRSKAMGFRNSDVWCVAPITAATNGAPLEFVTYDLWAVGKNCCNGMAGDFHCGGFGGPIHDPYVHAGLRLLPSDQEAFYELAVQQAEAAFGIKSQHPIFVHWMQDPAGEVRQYQERGVGFYVACALYHLALQLLLLLGAGLLWLKHGSF